MHSSLAYKSTVLYAKRRTKFADNDYLLANAAYALSLTVIPQIKGAKSTAVEARFSILHRSACLKIENAFGWLKMKRQLFMSLPVKEITMED